MCVCVCRHVWVYERESIRMWVWRAHVHTFEQLIVFCSDSLLVMAITGSLFMTKCRWIPPLHLYLFNLWAYVCVCVCVCVCVWGGGVIRCLKPKKRICTTPKVGIILSQVCIWEVACFWVHAWVFINTLQCFFVRARVGLLSLTKGAFIRFSTKNRKHFLARKI